MANDYRSPSEIERDIERNRAELTRNINDLQARFTPETLIADAMRTAREHGGDIGTSVTQSVKQNPMGLALTGIGLAWMVFGRSFDPRETIKSHAPNLRRTPDPDFTSRRPAGPKPRPASYPDWWIDEEEEIAEYYGYPADVQARGMPGEGGSSGPSMTERARSTASAAAGSVKSGAASVAEGIGAAGASISDTASSAARGSAEQLHHLRERLAHGTEHLSDTARERVIAARRRALTASRRASDTARRGWSTSRDTAVQTFEEYPLIGGAIALAVGAALAASLPSTRREDELFGRYSDDLMGEAERIYLEERERAERVAKAALDETRKVVEEKGTQADEAAAAMTETIRDEVADAGDRIRTAASREAKAGKTDTPGA